MPGKQVGRTHIHTHWARARLKSKPSRAQKMREGWAEGHRRSHKALAHLRGRSGGGASSTRKGWEEVRRRNMAPLPRSSLLGGGASAKRPGGHFFFFFFCGHLFFPPKMEKQRLQLNIFKNYPLRTTHSFLSFYLLAKRHQTQMPTQKKVSQSKIPSRKHFPTPTPRAHTRGWPGTPESGKRGGGNLERNQQRDKGSGPRESYRSW